MNCHYHENEPATAQCDKCGRALCQGCADLYASPLCEHCARQMSSGLWQLVIKLSAIGAVLAIAYTVMILSSGGGEALFFPTLIKALILGCAPFGWHFLNEHLPRTILILPLLGWLIFFVLKFVGSIFIGWACCPWTIYQAYSIRRTVDAAEAARMSTSVGFRIFHFICGVCGHVYRAHPFDHSPCPSCGSSVRIYPKDDER